MHTCKCSVLNPVDIIMCISLPLPQIVDLQMDKALIFEDDVRFQANFKRRALRLMEQVEEVELDWDIM